MIAASCAFVVLSAAVLLFGGRKGTRLLPKSPNIVSRQSLNLHDFLGNSYFLASGIRLARFLNEALSSNQVFSLNEAFSSKE